MFLYDLGTELVGKAFMRPFNYGEANGNLTMEIIGEILDVQVKTESSLMKEHLRFLEEGSSKLNSNEEKEK